MTPRQLNAVIHSRSSLHEGFLRCAKLTMITGSSGSDNRRMPVRNWRMIGKVDLSKADQ